jgi:hypothetical protein
VKDDKKLAPWFTLAYKFHFRPSNTRHDIVIGIGENCMKHGERDASSLFEINVGSEVRGERSSLVDGPLDGSNSSLKGLNMEDVAIGFGLVLTARGGVRSVTAGSAASSAGIQVSQRDVTLLLK